MDSLNRAIRIFQRLNEFDSKLYSLKNLIPIINNLENHIYFVLRQDIIGSWNKRWDYSEIVLCGDISDYDDDQIIKFTMDSIFIYEDKALQMKSRYSIMRRDHRTFFSTSDYQIIFDNNTEKWGFHISTKNPIAVELIFPYSSYLYINKTPRYEDGGPKRWHVYVKPITL